MSSQFIYFISISTCGEFEICGEFCISYSNQNESTFCNTGNQGPNESHQFFKKNHI